MVPGLLAVFAWLLTLVGLGLAVLPLTMRVFSGLPDRGYGLTRTFGIVVVGWLAYLAAMLGFASYVGPSVLIIGLILGVATWSAWGSACLAELRARRRLIVAEEVVFFGVFALATYVRAYNAHIVGQEKFMDYAFVNALLRTTTLPAEDMWLAGQSMPYYYLGYLLAGLPAKIAGTPGPIAYNLAVVWVFASGFASAVSIVYGLVARRSAVVAIPEKPEPVAASVAPLSEPEEAPPPDGEVTPPPDPLPIAMERGSQSVGAVALVEAEPVAEAVEAIVHTPEHAGSVEGDGAAESAVPEVAGADVVEKAASPIGDASEADEPAAVAEVTPVARPAEAVPLQTAAFAFAVLAGILTMVVGNLVGPLELIAAQGWGSPAFWQLIGVKNLQAAPSGGLLPIDGSWWWHSSRVIANIQPDGITEFPYFSFLLGDLHPHYLAIPFTLLVVALTLTRWLGPTESATLPAVLATGLVLATLVPASTWDVPAFWGLYVLGALVDSWRRHRSREKLVAELPTIFAPFAVAVVAVVPYFIGYQSQPLGLGIVRERTPLVSMLIIFGPVMVASGLFAVWLGTRRTDGSTGDLAAVGRALVMLGLMVLAMTAVGQTTLAVLVALLIGIGAAGWSLLAPGRPARIVSPTPIFCWLLATWAFTILVGLEVIYLRDVFGTRMNSVFKFQYQAWLLLALSSAGGLGLIWTRSSASRAWRTAVGAVVVVMLVPGLVYPLAATWTKSNAFRGEPTLMGDRFLERGAPADYRAIEWLRTSTEGRPVVVEAIGGDYSEHARVSTFSGLPTLMGWVGHELQWRGERPELRVRPEVVDQIYRSNSQSELARIFRNYGIRYVFFGNLEREKYGAGAQGRLDRLLPVAYSRGGTTIYSAPPDADPVPVP
jgi:YYY domain-containing protein